MLRTPAAAALLAAAPAAAYRVTSWTDLAGNAGYSYADYLREYGKAYPPAERARRERTFAANLRAIRRHNADPHVGWRQGLNQFTDWDAAELRQRRMGYRRAPPLRTDAAAELPTGAPPATVDWRKHSGVLTAVKDQRACGSCWAFSAAEAVESAVAIAEGAPAPVLSPQQLVSCVDNPDDCGGSGGCRGATQELAFNYTRRKGLTTEDSYPYRAETGSCQSSRIDPIAASIKGHKRLAPNDGAALAAAVARQPVAVSAAASAWQSYEGGVYDDVHYCGTDVNHAILLVGYGRLNATMGYWIVRNSWGSEWGERGYIRLARFGDAAEPCAMDTAPEDGFACSGESKPVKVCGTCGILSDSSYPTGASGSAGPPPPPTPRPGPAGEYEQLVCSDTKCAKCTRTQHSFGECVAIPGGGSLVAKKCSKSGGLVEDVYTTNGCGGTGLSTAKPVGECLWDPVKAKYVETVCG